MASTAQSKQLQNFRYRPEVDGLRALAVIPVLFYPAGFALPGGFMGVVIFSVISGYLITTFIVRDLQRGSFKMRDFWVHRILPAAAVMVIATIPPCLGVARFDHDPQKIGIMVVEHLEQQKFVIQIIDSLASKSGTVIDPPPLRASL